jgi:four helix bundle protein
MHLIVPSIVLNIAEGAGTFSKPDKWRYYLSASGSTSECAAIVDECLRLKLVPSRGSRRGKAMPERIAAMVVKLAKAQEA